MRRELDLEQCWQRWFDRRDPVARDRIIVHYSPLVKFVAGRVGAGLPNSVDPGDLVSAGVFGLIDAVDVQDDLAGVARSNPGLDAEAQERQAFEFLIRLRQCACVVAATPLSCEPGSAPTCASGRMACREVCAQVCSGWYLQRLWSATSCCWQHGARLHRTSVGACVRSRASGCPFGTRHRHRCRLPASAE